MIYLDTSAILKLLQREPETEALLDHLDAHANQDLVTSSLATVETSRALTATGASDLAMRAVPAPDRIELSAGQVIPAVAITARVLQIAFTLPPPILRTLDAIHVATAQLAGTGLDHLITYDKRLIVAAEAAGMCTASPS